MLIGKRTGGYENSWVYRVRIGRGDVETEERE